MNSRNFNFPPIFKAVRAYHGIGQEELASIIECSQSNISKIENNQKNPDLEMWFNFTRAFHISDVFCCYDGIFSFKPIVFDSLIRKHSLLAPTIDFSIASELTAISELKKLNKVNFKKSEKTLAKFLKSKNFNPLILVIEDHPIPFSLIDEFKLGLNNSNKKLL